MTVESWQLEYTITLYNNAISDLWCRSTIYLRISWHWFNIYGYRIEYRCYYNRILTSSLSRNIAIINSRYKTFYAAYRFYPIKTKIKTFLWFIGDYKSKDLKRASLNSELLHYWSTRSLLITNNATIPMFSMAFAAQSGWHYLTRPNSALTWHGWPVLVKCIILLFSASSLSSEHHWSTPCT